MYFRLRPDCFFTEGVSGDVIYDIPLKKVYVLDKHASDLLKKYEQNTPISNTSKKEECFLKNLVELGVGYFEKSPVIINRFTPSSPVEIKGFAEKPPNFKDVFLEITDKCNLSCHFCGDDNYLSWQGCQVCLRKKRPDRSGDIDIEKLIKQLNVLGVKTIIIRGGNPLLEIEKLKRVIEVTGDMANMSLIITTVGVGVSKDEIIKLCKFHNRIYLNIIMFGIDERDYKSLHNESTIYSEQIDLIEGLIVNKIPFYVNFFIKNTTDRNPIIKFTQEKWNGIPSFAKFFCYDYDKTNNGIPYNTDFWLKPWESIEEFFFRIKHNPCLYGRFELGIDGLIRPCPFIDYPIGDIFGSSLQEILSNPKLYYYWDLDRSKIGNCGKCSLYLACTDCISPLYNGKKTLNLFCPLNIPGSGEYDKLGSDPECFIKKILWDE